MTDPGSAPVSIPMRDRGGPELRRIVKYGIVGVSNTAIDFAVYVTLVSLGVWYLLAKVLAMVVACLNGYTWNRRWTFRAGAHAHAMLGKYALVQTTALGFNLVLLATLVEVVGLHEIVAQAIALPVVVVVGFLGQRHWTFNDHI